MVEKILFPVLISFGIATILGPIVIPFLRRLKVGQTEREELESHQIKTGTPTMGGLIILAAIVITSLFYVSRYPKIIPIVFLTVGFGVIGFLDDYLKVVLRRSDGLLAWQKMLLQIVVTTIFAVYLVRYTDVSLTMLVPFSGGHYIDLGWLAIPLMYFAVIGTVNGVNFTDGLDGLAASVTILNAVFFSVASIGLGNGVSPSPLAVIGSLLGFLIFNVFPARVFMGDTGSLALGGFVSGMACFLRLPLFLPLVGFIYMMEILSVILQVSFFKLTKGKRIFKMTPIHHHFELMGWSETQIVTVFATITAILCLIALMGL